MRTWQLAERDRLRGTCLDADGAWRRLARAGLLHEAAAAARLWDRRIERQQELARRINASIGAVDTAGQLIACCEDRGVSTEPPTVAERLTPGWVARRKPLKHEEA